MAAVRAMLCAVRLEAYADQFEENGYDDLEFLAEMSKEALGAVADELGLKLGHKAKLLAMLPKYVAGDLDL